MRLPAPRSSQVLSLSTTTSSPSFLRFCAQAQALKSPGASALPKSYKLKLYGFILMDIPGGSDVKVSACNAGDPGSIPGSGRSPGEGPNAGNHPYYCMSMGKEEESQVTRLGPPAPSQQACAPLAQRPPPPPHPHAVLGKGGFSGS